MKQSVIFLKKAFAPTQKFFEFLIYVSFYNTTYQPVSPIFYGNIRCPYGQKDICLLCMCILDTIS